MPLKLKKLRNCLIKNNLLKEVCLPFSLVFFLTLFAMNNKLFLLAFLMFGLFLFFYLKKSFFEVLILMFISSIPFENPIRYWVYTITPPLFSNVITSGYDFYFGITLKLIFGFGLFLLFVFNYKKINDKSLETKILLMFFLVACVNTFFLTEGIISILGLIRIWLSVLIFLTSRYFFTKNKNLFFSFIISLFIFSSFVGGLQLIKQKPIGLYVELTPSFSEEVGYATTDGNKQYRVSGFISHPVYFASFISILFPIFLGFFLKKINNDTTIFEITIFTLLILIGSGVILGTLSRSSFFTLLITLLIFRKEIWEKIIIRYQKNNNLKIKVLSKIFCLLFVFGVTGYLTPRLESFSYLFETNGNGSIRLELIKQSFSMVCKNPLGVGLNNFTKELITYDLPGSLNGFIVPVHNTFLIFFTELGILGGFSFVIFIFYIFFKEFNKKKKDLANFGVWVGILTFLINSQIHPLFNLDPTFDLLMLVLGYYSICLYQKK